MKKISTVFRLQKLFAPRNIRRIITHFLYYFFLIYHFQYLASQSSIYINYVCGMKSKKRNRDYRRKYLARTKQNDKHGATKVFTFFHFRRSLTNVENTLLSNLCIWGRGSNIIISSGPLADERQFDGHRSIAPIQSRFPVNRWRDCGDQSEEFKIKKMKSLCCWNSRQREERKKARSPKEKYHLTIFDTK